MLVFRGTDWCKGLSPEQMQQIGSEWMASFKRLTDQGNAISGNPVEAAGKIVSGKGGRVVAGGPFAESKEAIGGYFLLRVNGIDEAVAIAQGCPGLPYGATVGWASRQRGARVSPSFPVLVDQPIPGYSVTVLSNPYVWQAIGIVVLEPRKSTLPGSISGVDVWGQPATGRLPTTVYRGTLEATRDPRTTMCRRDETGNWP